MKLKNFQVIALAESGVLSSTNHDVDVKDAYKVFKLRKAISKAMEALQDNDKSLLKECGIEDAQEFDKKRMELRNLTERTKEQEDELKSLDTIVRTYFESRAELHNDEVDLGEIPTISYESWFALQNENREKEIGGRKVDIFSGVVEEILENIFWSAPEE